MAAVSPAQPEPRITVRESLSWFSCVDIIPLFFSCQRGRREMAAKKRDPERRRQKARNAPRHMILGTRFFLEALIT